GSAWRHARFGEQGVVVPVVAGATCGVLPDDPADHDVVDPGQTGAGRAREQSPAGRRRCRLSALTIGIVEPEEVALGAVLLVLLVDEVQLPLIEGLEPLVPVDVLESAVAGRVAAEVEAEDPEVVAVFGTLDGRRYGLALLGPAADDVVVGRHQG